MSRYDCLLYIFKIYDIYSMYKNKYAIGLGIGKPRVGVKIWVLSLVLMRVLLICPTGPLNIFCDNVSTRYKMSYILYIILFTLLTQYRLLFTTQLYVFTGSPVSKKVHTITYSNHWMHRHAVTSMYRKQFYCLSYNK